MKIKKVDKNGVNVVKYYYNKKRNHNELKKVEELTRMERPFVEDPIENTTANSTTENEVKVLYCTKTKYTGGYGNKLVLTDYQKKINPLTFSTTPINNSFDRKVETDGFASESISDSFNTITSRTSDISEPPKHIRAPEPLGPKHTRAPETLTQLTQLGPRVTRTQWIIVPEFLTEDVWERHQYSRNDIRKTLQYFPTRILWQLLLSYNKSVARAMPRMKINSRCRIVCDNKSTAIDKIMIVLEELYPKLMERVSVTWNMNKNDDPNGDGKQHSKENCHLPNLPVHKLAKSFFMHLENNLCFQNSDFTKSPFVNQNNDATRLNGSFQDNNNDNNDNVNNEGGDQQQKKKKRMMIKNIFYWRKIMITPYSINETKDLILMVRILSYESYVQMYGSPTSLRHFPNLLYHKNKNENQIFVVLDECFYFYHPRVSEVKHHESFHIKEKLQNEEQPPSKRLKI